MKTLTKSIFALAFGALSVMAQLTTTQTTTTAALTASGNNAVVCLTASTGVNVPAVTTNGTYLGIEQEAMQVTGTQSSLCYRVKRGALGTAVAAHASGANVWIGNAATGTGDSSRPFSGGSMIQSPPAGACTASAQYTLPVVLYGSLGVPNQTNGTAYTCGNNGQWGKLKSFWVSPTMCTFAPTTLTTTNTYIQVGASTVFVLNGTSNAAAGTNTLTCNIEMPALINTSSAATLDSIQLFVGSQTTAPTSVGTPTLGTITFPAAATTGTASTVTPVTAGSITAVTPTAITSTTTAGAFLTMGYTFASAVPLNVSRRMLQFTQPFVQSAAAAMTLNTPGLLVNYVEER